MSGGEVASLGLSIDSAQVKTGTQDLKDFSGAAGEAGKAADTLGTKTKASVGVFGDMSKAIAGANANAKDGASTVAQMGASINAALAKNVTAFDTMRKGITDANTANKQFAQGAETAAAATVKLASAHGGLSAQGQALFHTTRSLTEQLIAGQISASSFAQQIGHLSFASTGPSGLSGAFKEVASLIGGLATPTNAAIAGVVALTAAAAAAVLQYDKLSVSAQRAISGAGARTGTTTSDINAFVDKNTPSVLSGTTLSQKESRALAEGLIQTGDVVISKLNSMSAAVVGFSNQTGQSMDESVKAFVKMGGDPVRAMDELSGVFGPFSQGARTLVQDMVAAGDKTLAWNAILNELGPTAKGTADNLTFAEKSTRGFVNFLQTAPKPTGLEKQLEDVRQQLNGAIEAAQQFAEQGVEAPPEVSNSVAALSKQFENLHARQQAVMDLKASGTFNDIADKARMATDALIPQNQQLRDMTLRLNQLKEARDKGAGGPDNDAAIAAQQNLINLTGEAKAQAERYNERVAEISSSWGDVGQQTALSLQAAQNQLPVIEAVGGASKMAAQATADYKNYIDQGKSSTEAAALAAANLAAAHAQVNSAAQELLLTLQDQYAVAAARTPLQAASAQAAATENALLRQGVDLEIARAVASQQYANAAAQIYEANQKTVQASQDNLDKIQAQGTGMEGVVASTIAYRDAIQAGATATQAAAIAANTLQASMQQAANAAAAVEVKSAQDLNSKISGAVYNSEGALVGINNGIGVGSPSTGGRPSNFNIDGKQYTSDAGNPLVNYLLRQQQQQEKLGIQSGVDSAFQSGGLAAAFAAAKGAPNMLGADPGLAAQFAKSGYDLNTILGQQTSVIDDKITAIDNLTQLQNAKTNDKGQQIANLQAEMDWLQSLPETISRDQKIVSLQQSIDSLKNATDANTAVTQATLNPLYSQGHGALPQIGYFHAASGLDVVAQGPSTGDQIPFKAMVNGGERITISTRDQQANDNITRQAPATIVQNFDFRGTQNNSRRTVRQFVQGFGQTAAAMSR
ncbi:phage tail length tape measure family protein [Bradyrhizobium sp. USDA 3458]|uniref:phage tail length tape measure family protein n=1 Tax=Bradyrhizobium sp. USDA 3458 TaxID=2591461 RepID=UPI001141A92F|nr:phage tail length tape measure family protein [Bradyrhizobium sp. USDA 3458]